MEDYYEDSETGNMIFTEKYLIEQETCCGTGCKHCPYDPSDNYNNDIIKEEFKYLKNE